MRSCLFLILFSLFCLSGLAQDPYQGADIDTTTPEGQLLTEAATTEDAAQRAALYEKFLADYPDHKHAELAITQLQTYYTEKQDWDKVLAMSDKLLGLAPSRADLAHKGLKAAEAKKDTDLLVTWSQKTHKAAGQMAARPKPEDADAVEAWQKSQDYAKQVAQYAEYSVYAAALQEQDPKKRVAMIEKFLEIYPKSEYAPQVEAQRFDAYRATGDEAAILKLAKEESAKNPNNEDMLLLLANDAFKNKDVDAVVDYSTKLIDLMEKKPKPDNVDQATWDNKKQTLTGVAYYMRGMTKYSEQDLLNALPAAENNPEMKGEILFTVGLNNYRYGEKANNTDAILAAVKYFQQCAAVKSRYQAQANTNLRAIRARYRIR